MGKKKTTVKAKASYKNVTPDLPQNIIQVGDRVLDDKNIYIHQKVYREIHRFAANKTENEHGGILVGRVLNEMGKENTIIEEFIEAKHNTATPTTLTFTHETWDYFHSEMDKKYKDKKIVGWIHTHPNFGIFLSENDRFIQQNFFTDSNQVAYVIDPIQNEEGFFFWVNEKLERCPGFYLFDKNGVKIRQKVCGNDELKEETKTKSSTGILLPIIMAIVIIVNIFFMMNQSLKINKIQKEIDHMKKVINNQQVIIKQLLPMQTNPDRNNHQDQDKYKDKDKGTEADTDEEQNSQPDIPQNHTNDLPNEKNNDGGAE